MDISEDYIRMCGKAEEIQKDWAPEEGDFIKHNLDFRENDPLQFCDKIHILHKGGRGQNPQFCNVVGITELSSLKNILPIVVWLPRQDQLQELAWDRNIFEDNIDHLLMRFHIDTEIKYPTYYMQFRTMEQRALAFVMCTKYDKLWNNNNWIKRK